MMYTLYIERGRERRLDILRCAASIPQSLRCKSPSKQRHRSKQTSWHHDLEWVVCGWGWISHWLHFDFPFISWTPVNVWFSKGLITISGITDVLCELIEDSRDSFFNSLVDRSRLLQRRPKTHIKRRPNPGNGDPNQHLSAPQTSLGAPAWPIKKNTVKSRPQKEQRLPQNVTRITENYEQICEKTEVRKKTQKSKATKLSRTAKVSFSRERGSKFCYIQKHLKLTQKVR